MHEAHMFRERYGMYVTVQVLLPLLYIWSLYAMHVSELHMYSLRSHHN
jgi:hypothetical protein